MNNKAARLVKILFFVIAAVELYAEFVHHREMMFVLKPFLLPLLALYYVLSVGGKWNKAHLLMIPALFFSWVGDVSLLLTPEHVLDTSIMGIPKNKNYFFGGVGGFLVSHLFFISVYLQSKINFSASLFSRTKWPFMLIVLFVVAMIVTVVPRVYANPEKSIAAFPVVIYAVVLGSMVFFALNRYGFVNAAGFWSVFVGSVWFLISDSMIAVNFLAFEGAIPKAGFWIMLTFLAAEFLIAEGILKTYNKEKSST
jgi:uncharacterized membrane protein YhhN